MTQRTYFGVRSYSPLWPMVFVQVPLLPLLFATTTSPPWWNVGLFLVLLAICIVWEVRARRRYVSHPPDSEWVGDYLVVPSIDKTVWVVVDVGGEVFWAAHRATCVEWAKTHSAKSLAAEATA